MLRLTFLTAAALASTAGAEQVKQSNYTEQMFADAVADRHITLPPFVLVTIVDGITNREKTGCVLVSNLAGAIALERGWTPTNPRPTIDEVDDILLRAPRRRFVFKTARWLMGSGYPSMERDEKACSFLRQGIPAFIADMTGEVVLGRPGHALEASKH